MLIFKFLSKKNQRVEEIQFELKENGWYMVHPCYTGLVNPCGRPFLQYCIEENYAVYPPAFGDALEELWNAAHAKKLPESELQANMDDFSKWIMEYQLNRNNSPWKESFRSMVGGRIGEP
jgi:hypothetical protein